MTKLSLHPKYKIYVVEDGFTISVHQTWVQGVYDTPEAALAWAHEPPNKLAKAWKVSCPKNLGMPSQ